MESKRPCDGGRIVCLTFNFFEKPLWYFGSFFFYPVFFIAELDIADTTCARIKVLKFSKVLTFQKKSRSCWLFKNIPK